MENLTFRSIRPSDLETVSEIAKKADPFGWTIGNFQDAIRCGDWIHLALLGETVIGYSVVKPFIDESELLEIAVSPQFQGKGYGKALLAHSMDHAKSKAIRLMRLEVRVSNTRAQNLYVKFGFEIDGHRKNYYRTAQGHEDALLMTSVLPR